MYISNDCIVPLCLAEHCRAVWNYKVCKYYFARIIEFGFKNIKLFGC